MAIPDIHSVLAPSIADTSGPRTQRPKLSLNTIAIDNTTKLFSPNSSAILSVTTQTTRNTYQNSYTAAAPRTPIKLLVTLPPAPPRPAIQIISPTDLASPSPLRLSLTPTTGTAPNPLSPLRSGVSKTPRRRVPTPTIMIRSDTASGRKSFVELCGTRASPTRDVEQEQERRGRSRRRNVAFRTHGLEETITTTVYVVPHSDLFSPVGGSSVLGARSVNVGPKLPFSNAGRGMSCVGSPAGMKGRALGRIERRWEAAIEAARTEAMSVSGLGLGLVSPAHVAVGA